MEGWAVNRIELCTWGALWEHWIGNTHSIKWGLIDGIVTGCTSRFNTFVDGMDLCILGHPVDFLLISYVKLFSNEIRVFLLGFVE